MAELDTILDFDLENDPEFAKLLEQEANVAQTPSSSPLPETTSSAMNDTVGGTTAADYIQRVTAGQSKYTGKFNQPILKQIEGIQEFNFESDPELAKLIEQEKEGIEFSEDETPVIKPFTQQELRQGAVPERKLLPGEEVLYRAPEKIRAGYHRLLGQAMQQAGGAYDRRPEKDDSYNERVLIGKEAAKKAGISFAEMQYQGTNPILPSNKIKGLSQVEREALFTYLYELKREEQQRFGRTFSEEGTKEAAKAEKYDPTWYNAEKYQKKIDEIEKMNPGIAKSWNMGDVSGMADVLVADAILSGDKNAIGQALDVQARARETGKAEAERTQSKKGFVATVDKIVNATANMLPMMSKGIMANVASVVLPGAGQLAASLFTTNLWARQGIGDIAGDLTEKGLDPSEQIPLLATAGLVYAIIENVEVGHVQNISLTTPVKGSLKKSLFKIAREKGVDYIGENLEEVVQELVTTDAMYEAMKSSGIKVNSLEVAKKLSELPWKTIKETAGPMGILSLLGFGVGAGKAILTTPEAAVAPEKTKEPATTKQSDKPQSPELSKAAPVSQDVVSIESLNNSLKKFNTSSDKFWNLPEEDRNSIIPHLSESEQEALYGIEDQSETGPEPDIDEIRRRVQSIDRDKTEKEEINSVNVDPTEGQKEAGNYRKAHIKRDGFDISIENPAGSERSGVDKGGQAWRQTINHDYGYIKGTVGKDKDHVDVFINPGSSEGGTVFVVNQVDPKSGKFDEHKCMIGFNSEQEAKEAYLSNYEEGWQGLGDVVPMPIDRFREWVYSDKTKSPAKPVTVDGKIYKEPPPKSRPVLESVVAKTEKERPAAAKGLKFVLSKMGVSDVESFMKMSEEEQAQRFQSVDEISRSTTSFAGTAADGILELNRLMDLYEQDKQVQTEQQQEEEAKAEQPESNTHIGKAVIFKGTPIKYKGNTVEKYYDGVIKEVSGDGETLKIEVTTGGQKQIRIVKAESVTDVEGLDVPPQAFASGKAEVNTPSEEPVKNIPEKKTEDIQAAQPEKETSSVEAPVRSTTETVKPVEESTPVQRAQKLIEEDIKSRLKTYNLKKGKETGPNLLENEVKTSSESQARTIVKAIETRNPEELDVWFNRFYSYSPVYGQIFKDVTGITLPKDAKARKKVVSEFAANKTGEPVLDRSVDQSNEKSNKGIDNSVNRKYTDSKKKVDNGQNGDNESESPVRSRDGRGSNRLRGLKPRRKAAVRPAFPESEYDIEYQRTEYFHVLNVELYNVLYFGYKDRNGVFHKGANQGWIDDYNMLTDSNLPGGKQKKVLSDYAKGYIQNRLDTILESEEIQAALSRMGLEIPEHIDDIRSWYEQSLNSTGFKDYHSKYEYSITLENTKNANLDKLFNSALEVFNTNPKNLTKDQRKILEDTWHTSIEDAVARKSFEQGDLFEGTPYKDDRTETEKKIEQIERGKKESATAKYKGTEGLPMFDKNEQEAMATKQEDLFSSPKPVEPKPKKKELPESVKSVKGIKVGDEVTYNGEKGDVAAVDTIKGRITVTKGDTGTLEGTFSEHSVIDGSLKKIDPPAGKPSEKTKKELAHEAFLKRQQKRTGEANASIKTEENKRDESLAKAADALKRLGESFLKVDTTRLNMVGTQQAELAFEAVSALVEAGIHEFKAIAIKVSELAKQYIDIPGFKEAIEDAYDAYTDVDENIPRRGETFDSIIESSVEPIKKGDQNDNGIRPGETLDPVETEDGNGVQKQGNTQPESERSSERSSGASISDDGKRDDDAGSRGSSNASDPGAGERNRVEDTPTQEYAPPEVPDKVDSTGLNYLIDGSDSIGKGGQATKADDTIRAVKVLKKIESENRNATLEEQKKLARFAGWGPLSALLNKDTDSISLNVRERAAQIREILTEEEYKAAYNARLNAHYTSPAVITSIWNAITRMGFKGGRVMEPAIGVGTFYGLRPSNLRMELHGVEKDSLSARVSKQLYQGARIDNLAYEDYLMPKNYFDLFISNVPFTDVTPFDENSKRYGIKHKGRMRLHNFYFAKSLYGVRPGGIVAFITTHHTLDATTYRDHLKIMADNANLLGAVRLPNNAFAGVANTQVVTDIVFLQKKIANTPATQETKAMLEVGSVVIGKETVLVNRYFIDHPEMVVGKHSLSGSMYSGKNEYTVEPFDTPFESDLAKAVANLPADIMFNQEDYQSRRSEQESKTLAPEEIPIGSFYEAGGVLYVKTQNVDDLAPHGEVAGIPNSTAPRLNALIKLKTATKKLFAMQVKSDAPLKEELKNLNTLYDTIVKRFGYLNDKDNRSLILQDPDMAILLSLENWNAISKTATKADFLLKRMTVKPEVVTSVSDMKEAYVVSLANKGGLDFEYMASLLNKDKQEVIDSLIVQKVIFEDPESMLRGVGANKKYIQREEYLSGNVRKKLREAQAAAEKDTRFSGNVEELEKVLPPKVGPGEIVILPNSPILDTADLKQFIADTFMGNAGQYRWNVDSAVEVTVDTSSGKYQVTVDNKKLKSYTENKNWGTPYYYGETASNDTAKYGHELFEAILNNRDVVINYPRASKEDPYVRDEKATQMAREKMSRLKEEFSKWVWKNDERAVRLTEKWNDTINCYSNRVYIHPSRIIDPSAQVRIPGCVRTLRPHQADVVWRGVQSRDVMMAHEVGAGKTLACASIAMELRRLGLRKKNLIVVPNHMAEQWSIEIVRDYPGAKVLTSNDANFKTPQDRRAFLNRAAMGDFDVVVMRMSHYKMIQMSPSWQIEFVSRKLTEMEEALINLKKESHSVSKKKQSQTRIEKDLQKRMEKYRNKISQLTDMPRDVGVPYFDEMGFDQLFVDEADNYKNLEYFSSIQNILGMGQQRGSEQAIDMLMKVTHLHEIGGGVIFATGTPISNSMVEAFHMMSYLQPEMLKEKGINSFDMWQRLFAEPVRSFEQNSSGTGLVSRNRFTKYNNVTDLVRMLHEVWDVVDTEYLQEHGILREGYELPRVKRFTVENEVTPLLADYMDHLNNREMEVLNRKRKPEKGDDIAPVITMHGKMATVDLRVINKKLPEEENTKLANVVKKAWELYNKYPDKAGVIFYDLTAPNSKNEQSVGLDVQREIKKKLVELGANPDEIALVHDYKKDDLKTKLFDPVNEGKIRIVIGNTAKMGAGTNFQKKLKWLFHVDAPHRPRDIIQREGRIIRQGNLNDEVEIYTFVTKGSLDSGSWELLARKAKMIRSLMNGNNKERQVDEGGDQFEEASIAAILNPLMKDRMELLQEIKKQKTLRDVVASEIYSAKIERRSLPGEIARVKRNLQLVKKYSGMLPDKTPQGDNIDVTILGERITDRKKAIDAFKMAFKKFDTPKKTYIKQVGEYGGFKTYLSRYKTTWGNVSDPYIYLSTGDLSSVFTGNYIPYALNEDYYNSGTSLPGGEGYGIAKTIEIAGSIQKEVKRYETDLAKVESLLKAAEDKINNEDPQRYADKVIELTQKLTALEADIDVDNQRRREERAALKAQRGDEIIDFVAMEKERGSDWAEETEEGEAKEESDNPAYAKKDVVTQEERAGKKEYSSPTEKKLTEVIFNQHNIEPIPGTIKLSDAPDKNLKEVIEKITGKEVIFLDIDSKTLQDSLGYSFDGVTFQQTSNPELRDKIFIDSKSQRPILWTAFHEFAHFLEQDSKLNSDFWKAVKLTDAGVAKIAKDGESEFAADIIGEMMSRADFWDTLAKQDQNAFKSIIKRLVEIISRVSREIKKLIAGDGFNRDAKPVFEKYIQDTEALRNELARILIEYNRGRGEVVTSETAERIAAAVKREVSTTFYSPLLKAVEGLKQEKGTGEQFFNMLTKAPGVKETEWKWMGLDDFLKGKKSITRREIEEFVRGNRVQVEEVEYNNAPQKIDIDTQFYDPLTFEEHRRWDELSHGFGEFDYEGYVNTRELTSDEKEELLSYGQRYSNAEADRDRRVSQLQKARMAHIPKYSEYVLPKAKNYREILLKMPLELPAFDIRKEKVPEEVLRYKSSHWDESNVVAHTRLNDRTGPDGERVLFVEEIQSDWERETREKGIKLTPKEFERYKQLADIPMLRRTADENEELNSLHNRTLGSGGVPNQPFLKNWQEVVLKRILRMAAEEGYDRVAWINGQQTADRYDLSKQVDYIFYDKDEKGKYLVSVYQKESSPIFENRSMTIDEIKATVGKDIADKIANNEGQSFETTSKKKLSGNDLKIGGEWAFNLYDKMIPQFLNKYGKKWGVNVAPVEIEGIGRQLSIPVNSAMKESVLYEGQPLFAKKETGFGGTGKSIKTLKSAYQKAVLIDDPEVRKEAENELDEAKQKAAKLEWEFNKLKGKLANISKDLLLERSEIALKMKEFKLQSLDEIRAAIYNYAKKIGLRGVPYNKVDTLLKNTKGTKGLEKAITIIDDTWNKQARRESVEELLKLVDKEYRRLKKIEAGKLKTTTDRESNIKLKTYLDSLSSNPPDYTGETDFSEWVSKMLNYYNQYAQKDIQRADTTQELPIEIKEWIEDPSKPLPDTISRAIRAMFSNKISLMSTAQIKQVIEDINSIRDNGRTKKEEQELLRKKRLDEEAKKAADAILETAKNPKLNDAQEAARKKSTFKKILDRSKWSLIRPEVIAKWLTGFKNISHLMENLIEPIYDAERKKIKGVNHATERFREIHKDVPFDKLSETGVEVTYTEKNEAGEEKEIRIAYTYDQMMFIYANTKNPGNLAHLRGTYKSTEAADSVIAQVMDKLPSEMKEAVDGMIRYYDDEQWSRMNEVFLREHDVELPKEENYFPIQNVKTDRAESAAVADFLARYSSRYAGVQKGMTKGRVYSAASFRDMSYLKTVTRNIMQSEHYIAYSDAVRETQRFLTHPDVREAITTKDENAYKELQEWLKAAAYGRINPADDSVGKMIDYAARNVTLAMLGFRATTGLMQLSSLPKGIAKLENKGYALRSAIEFFRNSKGATERADKLSAFQMNRLHSYDQTMSEIAEDQLGSTLTNVKGIGQKIKDTAMWHIGAIDKAVTTILWNAAYDEQMAMHGDGNQAVKEADSVIRNTQSIGGVVFSASVYRGNARSLIKFTSDLNQNINYAFEMANTAKNKKPAQMAVEAFWFYMVPTVIVYLVQNGLEWDDPEEAAKVGVNQFTGGIPLIGPVLDAIIGSGLDQIKKLRGVIPDKTWKMYASDILPTSLRPWATTVDAFAKMSPLKMLESAAMFTGMPYYAVSRAVKGTIGLTMGKGDLRNLFWSEYATKEESVYDSMARRVLKPRLKTDDRQVYARWYRSLSDSKKEDFRKYLREYSINLNRKRLSRSKK